jgi:hypothetical protein
MRSPRSGAAISSAGSSVSTTRPLHDGSSFWYLSGSEALVQAILNEPQIEAVNSHPEDRFDWLGDRINDLDSRRRPG